LYNKLKRKSAYELVDIRLHLARLRSIKSDQEIDIIKGAIAITAESLDSVMQTRKDAQHEYDLEHKLTYEFLRRGADGHSFSPIIATDKNAAIIHSISNKSPLQNAQSVLFDIGAELNGYAADISRVYALKKPSDRFVQVFNAVLDVQQQIIAYAKPGLTIKQLEQKTELLLSAKLVTLGVKGPTRHYYPHGVSHHLGLDVHDSADYKQPLEAGMIITVEPGLYFADEQIGVRIEDDILITDTGNQNLSANVPHDLLYYM
jgi:Xaa-Pro aminopeptidase